MGVTYQGICEMKLGEEVGTSWAALAPSKDPANRGKRSPLVEAEAKRRGSSYSSDKQERSGGSHYEEAGKSPAPPSNKRRSQGERDGKAGDGRLENGGEQDDGTETVISGLREEAKKG